MWLLSTPKRRHNQQKRGDSQDFDCTFIFLESKVQEREKTWEQRWREDHWKAKDATRGARSIVNPQLWTDDTAMRYTKIPTWQEDGMISLQNVQLSLPTRLTFRTLRFITTGLATRTPSRWKVATQIFKRALRQSEKTAREQQRCCSVFEKNKAKSIRSSHRRKEQGKEMS